MGKKPQREDDEKDQELTTSKGAFRIHETMPRNPYVPYDYPEAQREPHRSSSSSGRSANRPFNRHDEVHEIGRERGRRRAG